jgi:hypothetical protein
LALAWRPSTWSNTIDAAVALSGVLVLFTAAGMAQARANDGSASLCGHRAR